MKVRPARPTDVYRFAFFDTSQAPPHVAEVEQWVRQYAWAWYRWPTDGADTVRRLLVGDVDDELVAVAAHELAEPDVRYLMVAVVREDMRGQGLGRELLTATAADMRDRSPGCGIYGLVSPANTAMRHLAETAGAAERGEDGGSTVFEVAP